ncbi:MAG TPA: endonuclease III [Bacteroidetes bacterium]|nr:endonuclease III [Bacteroidota bacterium]
MAPSKKQKNSDAVRRIGKILAQLKEDYPDSSIALDYSNPLQLLIATILSAQCTDVRVNKVTPDLFKKYKSARDFANANQADLEQEIRSTGFFRNKAKSIITCCRALVERHNGQVPKSMEELVELGGVGRKTANCVLGEAYGINSGVIVDTHVRRVSQRLGLTEGEDPEKIESDLMQLLPQDEWYRFSSTIILHGRNVCDARKPDCQNCSLFSLCPSGEELMKARA